MRVVGLGHGKALAVAVFQGRPLGVLPGALDHQRVALARFERRPVLLTRLQLALDAAGIEEQREPCSLRVPQFLIEFEEGELDRLALLVE